MSKLFIQTRCCGDIFKSAVALVMKKPIAGSAKNPRRAIISCTGGGVTGGAVGNRKIGVVDNHQVQPAVSIVVKKGGTGAPTWIVRPGLPGYIHKSTIALIEIHLVRT